MTTIQVLFESMKTLPLEALEKVYEFIREQPYKRENRTPTPEEIGELRERLNTIVLQLHEEYADYADEEQNILDRVVEAKKKTDAH